MSEQEAALIARLRELNAEYEYGVFVGSAVVSNQRLNELERLMCAKMPALFALADEAIAGRAVIAATAGLRHTWDALCRCVDEFAPEDMAACAERRDDLDGAILAVLAARAAEGGV